MRRMNEGISLKDLVLDGTHRFAPMSGLDIEPNSELDEIDNIQIERCTFTNYYGIFIFII